jgi:hypothetical protein
MYRYTCYRRRTSVIGGLHLTVFPIHRSDVRVLRVDGGHPTVVATPVHWPRATVCTVLSHLTLPFAVYRATVYRLPGYRSSFTVLPFTDHRATDHRSLSTVQPFTVHRPPSGSFQSMIPPITPLSSFVFTNEELTSMRTA